MRNLILLNEKHVYRDVLLINNSVEATFTKSPTDNKTFFLTSKGEILEDNEKISVIADGLPDLKENDWFLLFFVVETESLCAVSKEGSIVNCEIESKSCSLIGSITDGIKCLEWNMDQTLIAIVTNAGNVLVMTNEWDSLGEIPLIDFNPSSQTQISWRGNEDIFSITFCNDKDQNVIMTFNKELNIISKARDIDDRQLDYLLPVISWRYSMEILATAEMTKRSVNILLLELNGFKRSSFSLRLNSLENFELKKLCWNMTSDLLCIIYTQNESTYCEIWYRNNYYWYLKYQRIFYNNQSILHCEWDINNPYLLYILLSSGEFIEMNYYCDINSYINCDNNNDNLIGVVDGSTLKLTNYDNNIIPPPFSEYELTTDSPILSFTICNSNNGNDYILLYSSNNVITVYKYDKAKSECNKQNSIQLDNDKYLGKLRQMISTNKNNQIAMILNKDNNDNIITIDFSEDFSSINNINVIEYSHYINRIINSDNGIEVVSSDGVISKYNKTLNKWNDLFKLNESIVSIESVKINGTEYVLSLSQNSNVLYCNNDILIKGITSFDVLSKYDCILYIKNVIQQSIICFIPFDNIVNKNIELSLLGIPVIPLLSHPTEKGSHLVLSNQNSVKITIQTPRGNIETVSPRYLIYIKIINLLNERKWKESFELARTNRADLDIICDVNPQRFIYFIEEFIQQVNIINWLNIFIMNLKKDNIIPSDIINFLPKSLHEEEEEEENENDENNKVKYNPSQKIDIICETIRNTMMKKDLHYYNLSIISTYIKQNQWLKALEFIYSNIFSKANELDKAIDYITVIKDSEDLYNLSLELYNIKLAKLIIKSSQLNPQEYIPFLVNLETMEELEKKYNIDLYLENYDSAITHYFQMLYPIENEEEEEPKRVVYKEQPTFEKALSLIITNHLYKIAIDLINKNNYDIGEEKKNIIFKNYGDYLIENKRIVEAVHIYCNIKNQSKEIKELILKYSQECGLWYITLKMINELKIEDSSEISSIVSNMIETITKSGNNSDFIICANLLIKYCDDCEQAITLLNKYNLWNESLGMCLENNRSDLIETIIIPTLLEHYKKELEDIESYKTKYEYSINRLEIINKQKEMMKERDLCVENMMDDETNSVVSGISGISSLTGLTSMSSTVSVMSSRSNRTVHWDRGTEFSAKMKTDTNQRQRRNKNKSKKVHEGSPGEEKHLREIIKQIQRKIEESKPRIKEMGGSLTYHRFIKKAKSLQDAFVALLKVIETVVIPKEIVNEDEKRKDDNDDGDKKSNERDEFGWEFL